MKIKWLGHASFLITANDGIRVITDPYVTGGGLHYNELDEEAEIVTVSHEHGDHGNVSAVKGNPQIINSCGITEAKGIIINGILSHHDSSNGSQRGENIIFKFIVDGLAICHLGDLGHQLSSNQINEIGEVDILLTPVGGNFTVDAAEASNVCAQIGPKIIIPMHFKNEKCDFPIAGVEDFMKRFVNLDVVSGSEKDFDKTKLPRETKAVILKPAL